MGWDYPKILDISTFQYLTIQYFKCRILIQHAIKFMILPSVVLLKGNWHKFEKTYLISPVEFI